MRSESVLTEFKLYLQSGFGLKVLIKKDCIYIQFFYYQLKTASCGAWSSTGFGSALLSLNLNLTELSRGLHS